MSLFYKLPTNQNDNTSVIDTESTAELARLMRQDYLLTEGMGGIFPEGLDLSDVHRILDIACGPGGWVLEVAFAYSEIEVVGIDISQTMIAHADAQAKVQERANASFRIMNALGPLDFPDHSFDLVNARLVDEFIPSYAWPAFLQECLRILRPGGILRLTGAEWGFSNKPAFERLCGLLNQALQKAGRSFSPNGLHLGIVPMLRRLVQDAGCERIGRMAHVFEISSDTPVHEGFYHNLAAAFKLLQPFLRKWRVATQAELDRIYQQALAEMLADDFCAVFLLLTVYGYKTEKYTS